MIKYRKKFAEQVTHFIAASGRCSDRAVAGVLGVSREAVRKWRTYGSGDYKPEFAAAIEAGKRNIDCGKIKKAMVKRACGYKYTKKRQEVVCGSDGDTITTSKEDVQVAADVTAAKFVLANIGDWKDDKKIEHTGSVDLSLSKVLEEIDGDGLKPGK